MRGEWERECAREEGEIWTNKLYKRHTSTDSELGAPDRFALVNANGSLSQARIKSRTVGEQGGEGRLLTPVVQGWFCTKRAIRNAYAHQRGAWVEHLVEVIQAVESNSDGARQQRLQQSTGHIHAAILDDVINARYANCHRLVEISTLNAVYVLNSFCRLRTWSVQRLSLRSMGVHGAHLGQCSQAVNGVGR